MRDPRLWQVVFVDVGAELGQQSVHAALCLQQRRGRRRGQIDHPLGGGKGTEGCEGRGKRALRFRELLDGRDAPLYGDVLQHRQAHVRAVPKALERGRDTGFGEC